MVDWLGKFSHVYYSEIHDETLSDNLIFVLNRKSKVIYHLPLNINLYDQTIVVTLIDLYTSSPEDISIINVNHECSSEWKREDNDNLTFSWLEYRVN